MVAKSGTKKAVADSKVKKDIKKETKTKAAGVSKDFEVDEEARHTGTVTFYELKRGFGFIKLAESGIVPDDKVMVHWRSLQSDDRWPFLNKEMEVELSLSKKREGKDSWVVKAKDVTMPGGDNINLQEEKDLKREYVGHRNMRYLGNVKFFDFQKGFGYVKLQEGYDIPSEVPTELRISRNEINAGSDAPRLNADMEVEFGIAKNLKDQYSCYNMTLPGGDELSRQIVEQRGNESKETFNGTVQFWTFKGSYGMILPDDIEKFPADMKKAIKADHEKRKKKQTGKDDLKMAVYFRRNDKADVNAILKRGHKVSFKLYLDKHGIGACNVESLE